MINIILAIFAGFGREQLRLRTTGALPVVVRSRRSESGFAGPVGDRGVQVA